LSRNQPKQSDGKPAAVMGVTDIQHLCRIDRPSKLVISDYDICIFTRIVVTSTYLKFGTICDILGYHGFLGVIFPPYSQYSTSCRNPRL